MSESAVVNLLGTFDLANYGDLVLPAITERELARRIPDLQVNRFSPYGWDHPVPMDAGELAEPLGAPTQARRAEVARCDALIIGGGEIMHFQDRLLAPHYDVPADDVVARAPSTWWVDGTGDSCPVPTAWNAVGIPFDIEDVHADLVRRAATRHRLLVVRDQTSRKRLEQVGVDREILVVPDPGFLVPRLFDPQVVARRRRLHATLGWAPPGRYLVVQGNGSMLNEVDRIGMALDAVLADHPDMSVVVVETGAGHGDIGFADRFVERFPRRTWRPDAPLLPVDVVAIVAGAETFVGVSLHGAVTAIAHERRAVIFNAPGQTKLRGLLDHLADREGYAETPEQLPDAIRWALSASGPDPALGVITRSIDTHFDSLASMIEAATGLRDPSLTETPSSTSDSSGPRHVSKVEALRTAHTARGRRLIAERDSLSALIDERDHRIENLEVVIEARDREIEARDREIAGRDGHIIFLEQQIEDLRATIADRGRQISDRESDVVDEQARTRTVQAELDAVNSTKTMRWLRWPRRLYSRLRA